MKIIISLLIAGTFFFSACGKDTGYIKVKNRLSIKLNDVSWGNDTELGNLMPGESEEESTSKVGEEYIFFTIDGVAMRSVEKIEVDANTGATYLVEDSTDYQQE